MTRKITAKRRTRCACGEWTTPGERITWDPETRRTVGCTACHQTGEHPDPAAHADSDPWLQVL